MSTTSWTEWLEWLKANRDAFGVIQYVENPEGMFGGPIKIIRTKPNEKMFIVETWWTSHTPITFPSWAPLGPSKMIMPPDGNTNHLRFEIVHSEILLGQRCTNSDGSVEFLYGFAHVKLFPRTGFTIARPTETKEKWQDA